MAHAGGRPLKFPTPLDLQTKVDAYFFECDPHVLEVTEWVEARKKDGTLKKDKHGLNYLVQITHMVKTEQKHYTITGLALYLDTTRETLLEYEGEVEGRERDVQYADTIKRAKTKIQEYVERQLHTTSSTGAIFNLKANYRWKDVPDSEPPPKNPIQIFNPVPVAEGDEDRGQA